MVRVPRRGCDCSKTAYVVPLTTVVGVSTAVGEGLLEAMAAAYAGSSDEGSPLMRLVLIVSFAIP